MITSSRSLTRRHILRIGACAGATAAVGAVATLLRAEPPQPADLSALLPHMKPIQQALNQRACDLVDRKQLVRADGFIQTVDPAQLMIYFALVGDATHYLALREHAEKNLILTERDGSYTRGFVAWRWKQGEKPDASGTTEALRIARGLWLGAKAFNRPVDADLALQVIDGYARHAAVDQGVWMIQNYFNLNSHAWANNSFLVDYDPDFIREVADQQKDKDLTKLADNCYGVVKMAAAPSGLLYDVIQPELKTLYPELNVAFFSPNDVVQYSNCCATALAVAKGQPQTARKVLAFGLNRLDDLHAYYKGATGEPYNNTSAAVTEYSILARLAVRLGAGQAAATIADRAMNDWRWCVNHIETIQVFTLTEILLSLHEMETMKG